MNGRTVVITGASKGLGAAAARAFCERGARVALLARSTERLEAVVAELRGTGGTAEAWPTDVRDWEQVDATFRGILQRWGRIDVLVNLAGIKREGAVEEVQQEAAVETLRVNYLGSLACCRAVLPAMRRQGDGHIINVSSVLGKRATPGRSVYSASKAALNALTDALRMELAGTGIAVSLVCPGRLAEPGERAGRWEMNLDRAALCLVRCAERRPREWVLTPAAKALVWINTLAPGLLDRVLIGWRKRESSPSLREVTR